MSVDRARRERERGDGRTWRERALDAEARMAEAVSQHTEWLVTSFDPAVPMTLRLVLDSDEPRTVQLVEQAAERWGVELERVDSEEGDNDDRSDTAR